MEDESGQEADHQRAHMADHGSGWGGELIPEFA